MFGGAPPHHTNDVLLERLADRGNGNYAYVDEIGEATLEDIAQMARHVAHLLPEYDQAQEFAELARDAAWIGER